MGFVFVLAIAVVVASVSAAVMSLERSMQAFWVAVGAVAMLGTAAMFLDYQLECFKKWLREELDKRKENG